MKKARKMVDMIEPSPINEKFLKALLAQDEVASVIRSHLYVEAQLDKFIEITVVEPEFLNDLGLSYAKKVDLACCLGFDQNFRGALKRIGKLRNDFAHDLSSSLSKKVVADLFNALPEFGRQAAHHSVGMLSEKSKRVSQPAKYEQHPPKMQFALIVLNLERICAAACDLHNRMAARAGNARHPD
ncbi:MAG: hypothetical protein HY886_03400 [Deltaproteobacteria bacterium]|nr:hypothetical protein [Deltaproteobacteria bacterium]